MTGKKVAHSTLTGANIKVSTLGTVPNAAKLGGLAGSAYQRRVATACGSGQAIQSIGSTGTPTCHAFGQGTITSVTAGTGLTGGASSGDATLNVDPTVVQSRVTDTCPTSSAISSINQNGTASCQSTNVTQMMGGSGGTPITTSNDNLAAEGLSTPTSTAGNVQLATSELPSTAAELFVQLVNKPGSGNSWTFALMVNGTPQLGMSCKISDMAGSCSDTSGTVSIPAGAQVSLVAETTQGAPVATPVMFGWVDIS